MKYLLIKILNKLGYKISKISRFNGSYDPYSKIKLKSKKIIDLEALGNIATTIPGMTTIQSGQFLYTMCYLQKLKGDVVEIGSWQGRSSSFLARAVGNSKNGNFYAIDHFKGNKNKEDSYIIKNKDLSDLESKFIKNMERTGVFNHVNLLNMTNEKAEEKIKDIKIRFLFIDGDHTEKGVEKDINLFFPKLLSGSIIVFDDFSNNFPGLIKTIDKLLFDKKFSRIMTYNNTLVLVI